MVLCFFRKFNYPNNNNNNNMIESDKLKEGQSKRTTYNLILKKIKEQLLSCYGINLDEQQEIIALDFIDFDFDIKLKKGSNLVSIIFNLTKDKAINCEFQIDFHVNLTNSDSS